MSHALMMHENRYLIAVNGDRLGGRGRATWSAFGLLIASLLFGIMVPFTLSIPVLAIALGSLSAICFIASPVVMWRRLLRAGRELEQATLAWQRGDLSLIRPAAHFALREVFRADMRTRAFHLLGLAAEQEGDFAAAVDLFSRAEHEIPSMAAGSRKRDARLLMEAHRALSLAALGSLGEAHSVLQRASQDLSMLGQTGGFDALMDDSTWGLGSVSINEMLVKIEGGRPARAIVGLAWALFHLARGDHHSALGLIDAERAVFDHGLLPRERALIDAISAVARTRLGAGPHRAPAMLANVELPFVKAALARIAPT
jgi:hypothetical protein